MPQNCDVSKQLLLKISSDCVSYGAIYLYEQVDSFLKYRVIIMKPF